MARVRNTPFTPGDGTAKADVYQLITDRLVEKMAAGQIPWRKPWHALGAPRNYVTGHVYSGINAFLLNFLSEGLPLFLTFQQARNAGGHIRAGAKGFPILFYSVTEKTPAGAPEGSAPERRAFVRYSTVFNVADVEGMALELPEAVAGAHEPLEAAEAIVLSWADRPRITHLDQRAYYVPAHDYVNMPIFSSFTTAEAYYMALFHELTHATGHARRLNRPDLAANMATKGADGYAREELTAEMGAAFLCGAAGLNPAPTDENTAAYLQFWLGRLRDDKKLLVQAAGHAQKAANLILGYEAPPPALPARPSGPPPMAYPTPLAA